MHRDKLQKLQYEIGYSLLLDSTNFIGVHKFLDFNVFEYKLKVLFYSLFTQYISDKVAQEHLSWISHLKIGLEENNIKYLKENMPNLLSDFIDYILFKFSHYKLIDSILKNEKTLKDYEIFCNQTIFDVNHPNYPFTEYEVKWL